MKNLSLKISNPIFIVGFPHSGSSILTAILSMLKNVYTFKGESTIFYYKNYKSLEKLEQETFKNNKKRFLEKTPKHLYFIDDILSFYPKAKILISIRNGFDVINSFLKREKNFVIAYQRYITDGFEILKWKKKNLENIKIVKYEDLIENTIQHLKNICEFIEEPYQQNLLEYYKKPKLWYDKEIKKPNDISDNPKLRNWQINQPLFDGRNRWKKELAFYHVNFLINDKDFIFIMKNLDYDLKIYKYEY